MQRPITKDKKKNTQDLIQIECVITEWLLFSNYKTHVHFLLNPHIRIMSTIQIVYYFQKKVVLTDRPIGYLYIYKRYNIFILLFHYSCDFNNSSMEWANITIFLLKYTFYFLIF